MTAALATREDLEAEIAKLGRDLRQEMSDQGRDLRDLRRELHVVKREILLELGHALTTAVEQFSARVGVFDDKKRARARSR